MACYPQDASAINYITYPVGPDPDGVTLTSTGVAHTKSAYSQLAASSAFACSEIELYVLLGSGATCSHLIDLAIGAGGSEVVVVPNIQSDQSTGGSAGAVASFRLPLEIAAGTRIAVRRQGSGTSNALSLAIALIEAGDCVGISTFACVGANTATSRGALIDAGASINIKGAYVEMTPSTAAIYQSLSLVANTGNKASTTGRRYAVDVAIGASGSEVVLIPDLRLGTASAVIPRCQTLRTFIAASTRIALRCSCGSNVVGVREFDAVLLLGTGPSESGGGGAGGEQAHTFIG
jgi:hypothetical protein